jgi:hypothetical protein
MAVQKLQHGLPTNSEVWMKVRDFALDCLQKNRSVFTVTRRVENRITDVSKGSIGRRSADGTSNSSRVTKSMVEHLWSEVNGEGGGGYLYFTKALLLAALPEFVEDLDGALVLRKDPSVLKKKRQRARLAISDGRGLGGGEGKLHRKLKEFIYREPEAALASLKSGPYQRVAMEYVFPTGDRVDVVLIDGAGRILLVEIKPYLEDNDLTPFAQAAKYRVLWHILRDRPVSEIRCVVAAPKIANSLGNKMRKSYTIESVAVHLPGKA